MANPDFKKILIKDAYIQWPKLDSCYSYDRMNKEWQKVDKSAPNAAWYCGVLLDAEEAMKLGKELKAHYEECRSRNPSLPPYKTIFGLVKNDDGTMIFNGKKKGVTKKGLPNDEPIVIGGDKKPLEDRRIWSGSKGVVRFAAHPTTNPDGEGGVSLMLDAVQVTKAVYASNDFDDFEDVPMETVTQEKPKDASFDDGDPFGLPPIPSTATKEEVKPSNDLDDEIPF